VQAVVVSHLTQQSTHRKLWLGVLASYSIHAPVSLFRREDVSQFLTPAMGFKPPFDRATLHFVPSSNMKSGNRQEEMSLDTTSLELLTLGITFLWAPSELRAMCRFYRQVQCAGF